MSATDGFLSRLENVRRTGLDRWIARCPAHDDRRPSLAVRELEDGRLLIRCFANCGAAEVLSSVGMTYSDLYPDRKGWDNDRKIRERKPFFAVDVLRCVGSEALLVAVAASNIREGIELSGADHERLMVAAERLQSAVSYAT